MEKIKFEKRSQLIKWISEQKDFNIVDVSNNSFEIKCSNFSCLTINHKKGDSVNQIIEIIIETIDNYSIDDDFNTFLEYATTEMQPFPYTPSEFMRALMSDEQTLRELAKELREIVTKQNINH